VLRFCHVRKADIVECSTHNELQIPQRLGVR
jgi:hypothetical protein